MAVGPRIGLAVGAAAGVACGPGADELGGAPRNLIVIAGQSNAKGVDADIDDVTVLSGLKDAYPAVPMIQKLSDANGTPLVWTLENTGSLAPRGDDLFGVELSMGRYLDAVQPGRWGVVKFAVPSSSLGTNWKWDGTYPSGDTPLHLQFVAYMQAAEAALGGRIAAIVWIQGETDAGSDPLSAAYEDNLTDLIDGVRETFPDVPWVFNQLHDSYSATYKSVVRSAQAAVDSAVAGTTMIDVDDLGIVGAHFTANGYATFGQRCAVAVLGQLGINIPPVSSFTFEDTGLEVDFTDTSTDADGSIAAWSWNFGDSNTSTSQNPTHTYAEEGTYTVTLTVTDDSGAQHSSSQEVEVVDIAWTVDATSGKSWPANATEWGAFNAAWSLETDVPDHLYNCQELSGDLVDAIGSHNIPVVGTPLYDQTVSGWSRKAVGGSDGGTARFQTTGLAAPSGTAYFVLALYAMTGTASTARFVLGIGTSVSAAILALNTGKYRTGSGANVANASGNHGTVVRPLSLLADSVNNVTRGADDQETMVPTHTDAGTAGLYIPSSGATAGWRLLGLAVWKGAKAEAFTVAREKALKEALGFTVAYSP